MIGTVLDERYRLDQPLGTDGDTTTYRATDLRLGRTVLVTVLAPQPAADPERRERFHRAAAAAATLKHPAIAPIVDLAVDGEVPYSVEAPTDGQTVAELLRDAVPPAPEQILDLARQCARALLAAHADGVVHGALTPDRIVVDAQGVVQLNGFGRPPASAPDLETARYLAPEQFLGTPPDSRSDVYSLGAILYHLVTGRPPYDGPTALAIATQKQTLDPPAVDVPGVPPAVAAAIQGALRRQPAERFFDGTALYAVLTRPDVPSPMTAPEPMPTVVMPRVTATAPTPSPAAQPVRSGGAGALFAILVVLAIGGGIYYALTHPSKVITVPSVVGETESAAGQTLQDVGLRVEVTERRNDGQVPGGHVISQQPPAGAKVAKDAVVNLVISKGPRYVTVPPLVGLSESQAKRLLGKSGLAYGGSQDTARDDVADGIVTAQEPPAGQKVDKGAAIRLYVNRKPAEPPPPKEDGGSPPTAGDAGTGIVDEALEKLKEKAGEVAGDIAGQVGDRVREGAEDLKQRVRERVRDDSGGSAQPESPTPPPSQP